MDFCSVDWEVIASFAGAGATVYAAHIALSISKEWRTQKRSDIISDISKSLYKQRKEYKDKLIDFIHNISSYYISGIKDKEYKDKYKDMELIYKSFDEYRLIHIDFKTNLEIIYKYYSNDRLKKSCEKLDEFYKILDEDQIKYLLSDISDNSECFELSNKNFKIIDDVDQIIYSNIFEKDLIDYILHENS